MIPSLRTQAHNSYIKVWSNYEISPAKLNQFHVDFTVTDVHHVVEREGFGPKFYPSKVKYPSVRLELDPRDKYDTNESRIYDTLESIDIKEASFKDQVMTALDEIMKTKIPVEFRENPKLSKGYVLRVTLSIIRCTYSKIWEVAALEVVKVNSGRKFLKDDEKRDCAICLDKLLSLDDDEDERDDYAVKLPQCDHVFHQGCIKKWFIKTPTCPLCRSNCLPSLRPS